jgi:hypothetical protein
MEKTTQKQSKKEGNPDKTKCKPILLLHNIQTVINQTNINQKEYQQYVFYKFPFHLYKIEGWDVEHIDSNTTNDLKDNFSKLLWMLQYQYEKYNEEGSAYNNMYKVVADKLSSSANDKSLIGESEIKSRVKNIVFNDFDKVVAEIESKLVEDALDGNLKNQIGNFTLLDSSTNRGYGNSIFPRKRLVIMAKDRCMSYQLSLKMDADGNKKFIYEPTTDKSVSAFIPPVTRNVFMKYYSPMTTDFTTWSKADFDNYKSDIREVLKEFLQ